MASALKISGDMGTAGVEFPGVVFLSLETVICHRLFIDEHLLDSKQQSYSNQNLNPYLEKAGALCAHRQVG